MKEALHPFGKNYHKNFYALKNVSLELKRGESLGIIGRNGNGKSTLLKIIAGVLTPSKGHVNTKGRISAILELTSSLKSEMTGMENIYYNLRISGFKKNEIDAKVKEIEDFAEIGEFIDQPVKTYSSGMRSRLGFGIATSVEPDILILDEVLAVGDFVFQQKCLSKINAMREEMSVIFVSHAMNSVRLFCDRVIVLEKGVMAFNGEPEDAIKYYLEQEEERKKQLETKSIESRSQKQFYGEMFHNKEKIIYIKHNWKKKVYRLDEEMILEFSFKLNYNPRNLIIGVPVWDMKGNRITSFNTDYYNVEVYNGQSVISGKLTTSCIFNPGDYISAIAIVDGSEYLYRSLNEKFMVLQKERVFGFVSLKHKWEIDE
jgi:ABC-type polysaccharide/polyol phosphate transport system ATPase subunit